MRLNELAEKYRKNAEEILKNPDRYGLNIVNQAWILAKRDIRKALITLAKRNPRKCVSCAYSMPDEREIVNIKLRRCELKLKEEKCEKWRSIL